jgi:hypothetical protein
MGVSAILFSKESICCVYVLLCFDFQLHNLQNYAGARQLILTDDPILSLSSLPALPLLHRHPGNRNIRSTALDEGSQQEG